MDIGGKNIYWESIWMVYVLLLLLVLSENKPLLKLGRMVLLAQTRSKVIMYYLLNGIIIIWQFLNIMRTNNIIRWYWLCTIKYCRFRFNLYVLMVMQLFLLTSIYSIIYDYLNADKGHFDAIRQNTSIVLFVWWYYLGLGVL